jgi:hypothetical protein
MRLVLDRLLIAASFETELHAERAHRFTGWRLVEVTTPLEHADIEGMPKL